MIIDANTVLRRTADGVALGTGPDNVKGSEWTLVSNSAAAVIEGAGYLNAAAGQLRKGDLISASLANSGTPTRKEYVVTAVTPAVTIAAEV